MGRRWLVTGCSSGLGHALATAAARAGDALAVTARKTADLEDLAAAWPGRIVPIPLELRDAASCEEAVRSAAERLGGIDVLVNNAGIGLFGAVEEVSDAELRDQLETLVVGPLAAHPARPAADAVPRPRARRQHLVRRGSDRLSGPGRVRRRETRPGRHEPGAGRRGRPAQHPRHGGGAGDVRHALRHLHDGGAPADPGLRRDQPRDARRRPGSRGEPGDRAPRGLRRAGPRHRRGPGPHTLRIPVGDDAYGYLELAEQASREEFAAARLLTQGPPPPSV